MVIGGMGFTHLPYVVELGVQVDGINPHVEFLGGLTGGLQEADAVMAAKVVFPGAMVLQREVAA